MIEKIVLDHLSAALQYPVYAEEPEQKGQKFVVVQKTDGGKEDHICQAMILVRSHGRSKEDAANLNEEVKSAMEDLVEHDDICRVQLNSDYDFTDTAMKRYRYQAVFDITHY
jgi:hypothetical protein